MPLYAYECRACNHALEALHEYSEQLEECPACHEPTLERCVGSSPRLEAQRKKRQKRQKAREQREIERPRAFPYYCQNDDCPHEDEIIAYHETQEQPEVPCPTCDQLAVRGVPRNVTVTYLGWWPDKRRGEVKARFKRQEARAEAKGMDIDKLRGWAKKNGTRNVSVNLMDPVKDGRTDKNPDNSAGHFHHEQEL